MDPTATLATMLTALAERDLETAREAFDNIAEWIERGGFVPDSFEAAALSVTLRSVLRP